MANLAGHTVPVPVGQPEEENGVCGRRKQRTDQTLAVTPEPVELAHRIAPSVQFPRLQAYSRYPACSLLHSLLKRARKIGARSDAGPVPFYDRNEGLFQAE